MYRSILLITAFVSTALSAGVCTSKAPGNDFSSDIHECMVKLAPAGVRDGAAGRCQCWFTPNIGESYNLFERILLSDVVSAMPDCNAGASQNWQGFDIVSYACHE